MNATTLPKKYFTVAGILLAVFLCIILTTNFFGLLHIENRVASLWLSRIEFWIIALLLYLYATKVEKTAFLLWKEKRYNAKFYAISTVLTIGFIFLLLAGISIIQRSLGYNVNNEELNKLTKEGDSNLCLFIFTAFTAGITEELIFRAYLVPRIAYVLNNRWIAIIISSILFGLAHYNYNDLTRMVFPFIIGLIFSLHYFRYRSLMALIICHVIIDLMMV